MPPSFPKPSEDLRRALLARLYPKPGERSASLDGSVSGPRKYSESTQRRLSSEAPASGAMAFSRRGGKAAGSEELSLIEHSHGDIKDLVKLRGWETIIRHLLGHKLEFCYLQREPADPYALRLSTVDSP